jgi:hypothetical protein
MVSYGRTAGYSNQSTDATFITGSSAMGTVSWSIGLAQRDWFKRDDMLGLTLAMPTKEVSGTMATATAVAQNQDNGGQNIVLAVKSAISGFLRAHQFVFAPGTVSGVKRHEKAKNNYNNHVEILNFAL